MTQADWQVAVAAAYVVSGWYPSVEEVDLVLMNENELLRAAAAKLPIGTAVECRDGVLAARKTATELIALCNMKTLYLRNVPDEVVARLDRLARREGVSVSAVAIRELADVTRRADNEALLADLPDTGIEPAEVLAALDAGRRRA